MSHRTGLDDYNGISVSKLKDESDRNITTSVNVLNVIPDINGVY